MEEVTIEDCRIDKRYRVYIPGPDRTEHGIETGRDYDVRLDTDGSVPFRAWLAGEGRFRVPPNIYEMESFDVGPGDTVDVTITMP